VVFVHGAWMDLRYWEPQRQAVAAQYRFIASSLRYHGTAPWPDAGEHYAGATHVANLVALIREVHAGPVHLVGLSYGQNIRTHLPTGSYSSTIACASACLPLPSDP
jgi:pimeloyl-ACP methyl ester carboxylesterase